MNLGFLQKVWPMLCSLVSGENIRPSWLSLARLALEVEFFNFWFGGFYPIFVVVYMDMGPNKR